MTDLIRFGIAMERSLVGDLDRLADLRGVNRSEVIRDLVRAEVARAKLGEGAEAVAALMFVYDHHVRDLTEKLTELQHELGEQVQCSLHIHLDHHHCLEVVVLRGDSQEIQGVSDRLLATKGVVQGGLHMVPANLAKHHHRVGEGRHGEGGTRKAVTLRPKTRGDRAKAR